MSQPLLRSKPALALRDDDLAPVLLFIALAAFACLTPAQNDTWWHLRSGQEMWTSRSFLTTERFSFTAFGAPLHNHWWLSQLAFYAVYSAGGPVALTVFAGACAFLAVYGSWRLFAGSVEARIVLLVFLVIATAPEWSVRPQVISLALLVLSAHLIVRDRVVWLPVVCLVWGNTHAMVIFGVLMAGACMLEALLWTRARLARDAMVTVGCIVAPMLSPLGWEYWPRVLATVSMSRTLQLQEYMMPLGPEDAPFWLAVVALAVVAVLRRDRWRGLPRADRVLMIAAAGLALAGATATRNIAFFAVIAAPVLSRLWSGTPTRERTRPAGPLAYGLIGVAVMVAGVIVAARWRGGGESLGWRPIPDRIIRAVEACPEPTFNSLEDGGYLMWTLPRRKVFVDSRMEAYPLDLLRRSRAADVDGEYADLFADYGINCAVVATASPLYERMVRDSVMTAVLSDSVRSVFVNRLR